MTQMTSIEFCAGAGGQALGLEQAGFQHALLVDNDSDCCATLRANRPHWQIQCADMKEFSLNDLVKEIDLFAAGLPCPPFSMAGKQLGERDERNLFPAALRLIEASRPKFVMIENVRGFLSRQFEKYRNELRQQFERLGYVVDWRLLDAKSFGVSQTRMRVVIIASMPQYWSQFTFPEGEMSAPKSVGDLLHDLMAEKNWVGVDQWRRDANGIAPTIVGGSKKHGGPDLGPTRARAAWKMLGVNGGSIAEAAPDRLFEGMPRLTNRMVARVQGFPDKWQFTGRKTSAYRQVGNAFPPPVAAAIGCAIAEAIARTEKIPFHRYAAE